jgi:hypothetical protein
LIKADGLTMKAVDFVIFDKAGGIKAGGFGFRLFF